MQPASRRVASKLKPAWRKIRAIAGPPSRRAWHWVRPRARRSWAWLRPRLTPPVLVGLAAVIAYWIFVHPPDFSRLGYVEDYCQPDLARRILSHDLLAHGRPTFVTDEVMAPKGMGVAFMSWAFERDGIGALFWMISKNFPFYWLYFGASLIGSYIGVGWILSRMQVKKWVGWPLAALVVVFHAPRHFKTYYHLEHLFQHWVYWGVFLDAWIWQRFWKEKRISLKLEALRAACLLGMLWTAGYFWGPMVLEWGVLRAFMAAYYFRSRRRASYRIENDLRFSSKGWRRIAIALTVVLLIDVMWFVPLLRLVRQAGDFPQPMIDEASVVQALIPLWWKHGPIFATETVAAVGWVYWVPALIGAFVLPGLVAPFLVVLALFIVYMGQSPWLLANALRHVVPFLSYFRVTSRMALFFPQLLGAIIALTYADVWEWFQKRFRKEDQKRWFALGIYLFIFLSAVELSWLKEPIKAMPSLDPTAQRMMANIKESPGTTVLDMPFCVAGGNGVCTYEQCSQYPAATVGQCMSIFHEKKVYGLYQGRMSPANCDIYHEAPYASWFEAWRDQRCLNDDEWKQFCTYLREHLDLGAILVYPDIWKGAATRECQDKFREHLGDPLEEAKLLNSWEWQGAHPKLTKVQRYQPFCR